MKKSEKLLVVGGTGFIGNQLVRDAINLGYETTVLSLNEPGDNKKITGVKYLTADIDSNHELKKALSGREFNYVVNLGGYVDHSGYLLGGREVLDAHLSGVQNLVKILDWAPLKSFVQIGSSDEYGSHLAPQNEALREMPLDGYAMGKFAANQLLLMLNRIEKFPTIILRLFLVYGPEQGENRFLPQIIDGCMKGESFPASEGEQIRDFCYISDITYGILTAMKSTDAHGKIINIASGKPIKIKRILEEVKGLIGKGHPQYGKVSYRMGENMALYADISKAKEILSWEPTISIEEGLKRTIDYFKEKQAQTK